MQSLTTAVKMVGRSVDKKDEIRAYNQSSLKTWLFFEEADD